MSVLLKIVMKNSQNVQNLISVGCLIRAKGDKKNQKSISIHLSYLERLEYFNSNADLFSNISKYFEILDSSRVTGNNDHTH